MNNNYLKHYGVLGMKWGVRRYQNPDGSLTADGRKHRQKKKPTHKQLLQSTNAKEVYKNRHRLSDQELKNRINRIQMEQNLYELSKKGSQTNAGEKFATKFLNVAGNMAITALAAALIAKGKKAITRR